MKETEEQALTVKKRKIINLDTLYEELANRRAKFDLDRMYNFEQIQHKTPTLALGDFIQELYNDILNSNTQVNLKKIKEVFESRDLIEKLCEVEYSICHYMSSLRGDIHDELYKKGPQPIDEEAYYIHKGRKHENIYTKAIDQQLLIYIDEYIEKLIDTEVPANLIKILTYKGNLEPSIDDKTYNLRNLLQVARGEAETLNKVFHFKIKNATDKGIVFDYTQDIEHIQKYAYYLIKSHIRIIKERVESIPLEREWQTEDPKILQERTKEMYRVNQEKGRIALRDAQKRDREGIFYHLPEPVKLFGKDIKEAGRELKDGFVGTIENLGENGYGFLSKLLKLNNARIKKESDYSSEDKDLLKAVRSSNRDLLFSSLRAGANPFIRDDNGKAALKLLDNSTKISMLGYILSFIIKRPQYELYYDLKVYMAAYSLATKRIRAKLTDDVHLNPQDIANESDIIYNNKRVAQQAPTYTKEALEDANLLAFNRVNLFTYILSFIMQINAYSKNNYYHVRDVRVDHSKKLYQLNLESNLECKPKPSERLGYNTHKCTEFVTQKASSFVEIACNQANRLKNHLPAR